MIYIYIYIFEPVTPKVSPFSANEQREDTTYLQLINS